MLIDDNKIDVFISERVIEKYDPSIETIAFNNANSALKFFEGFDGDVKSHALPEAILLDVNMPGMSGFKFCKESEVMKLIDDHNIAIYMLSSSSCPDDIKKAQKEPRCSGYIIKPLTIDKLKNAFDGAKNFASLEEFKKII